ncbi:MAG TPA: CAP domain-containing protein [Bacteriovoracaceae bacterium]|nr:CAP domain-containing protein [Bacteriovoracaceae bacterium]
MKKQILCSLFILLAFNDAAYSYYGRVKHNYVLLDEKELPQTDLPKLSEFEQTYFEELNTARTNPKLYASYIREFLERFKDDGMHFNEDGILYRTNEGTAAVTEAIDFLEIQAPLKIKLTLSQGLTSAARDHVEDQGPKGQVGHYSSDGSDPMTRAKKYGNWLHAFGENISYTSQSARGHIIGLIVDDGVANRGHRTSLYNPAFKKAGVSCGPHKIYKRLCVLDLSGGFTEPKKLPGGAILLEEF